MAFKFICFVFMECNNWNIKDNKDKKYINKLLIKHTEESINIAKMCIYFH